MAFIGQQGFQSFGFQPQGMGNPAMMGGAFMMGEGMNSPYGMGGSPFGMGLNGNPMLQMMQMMMGMMMGVMAGQMMQQMMQQGGANQPFGQFAPGMNPGFGCGCAQPFGGSNNNGMGNFLGNGYPGGGYNNGNGGYNNGGGYNGPQGPNTMTPPSSTGTIDKLSPNKDERIRQVVDAAKRTYPDQPHMAKLAAAQALLESGIASSKGPSSLAGKYNNLFGIKGSGTAGSVNMRTGEHLNGRDVKINANFAANRTVEDSFQQHKKLMGNSRYRKVLSSQSFEQAAYEVRAAGYATDPNYTRSLISVYNSQLARYF